MAARGKESQENGCTLVQGNCVLVLFSRMIHMGFVSLVVESNFSAAAMAAACASYFGPELWVGNGG